MFLKKIIGEVRSIVTIREELKSGLLYLQLVTIITIQIIINALNPNTYI